MQRCLGCMEEFGDEYKICPHCGFVVGTVAEEAIHLNPGVELHGRYVVGKVIGYGGFGVTYVGWDRLLEQKVAIKEYLPSEFSTRMPGIATISIFGGDKKQQFHDGLDKFVEEARRLAKFQEEEGIVKVYDSFQENETAYIVMEYLDGETLDSRLKREKTIPETEAIAMLKPIMESLNRVHAEGMLHRDIAPDNIFITKNGQVKLIDFGASRYATTSHSRSLTVIIKPGFSPEEQYRSRGDQGTYTDVYALAATLYKMVTGMTPPDAMERRVSYETKNKDLLTAPHKWNKKISPVMEVAILNAMNVRIEDRTQEIGEFLEELEAETPAKRRYGKIKKIDLYIMPLWLKIALPTILTGMGVLVILLLTGILNFNVFSSRIVLPSGVMIVPDVEGMQSSEAIERIETENLLAVAAGTVESEYIEAGLIIYQDPVGGTYAQVNSNVMLTICSGSAVKEAVDGISTVPFVLWDSQEDALEKLQRAGLGTPVIVEEYDENVEKGRVISQSIDSGEEVAEGTVITLCISKGPAPFAMPSIEGMTTEEATELLTNLGIVVLYQYQQNDTVPANHVISQSILADSEVTRGTEVTLVISNRRETFTVPNVVGMTREAANEALVSEQFKVTVLENYSAEVETGKVISQTPTAGSAQMQNATIVIYVSKGKVPVKVSYNGNGGVSTLGSGTVYQGDFMGSMPSATRTGYSFEGWYTSVNGGDRITGSTQVPTVTTLSLYAHWKADNYTLYFDAQGGSASSSQKTIEYGAAYGNLPSANRKGYVFEGWYTSADGGTQISGAESMSATNDLTFYAHWTIRSFTVTFIDEGSSESRAVDFGNSLGSLPVPAREGYTFEGWYTAQQGGNVVSASTTISEEADMSLYAHWKANEYTVTLNAVGGTCESSGMQVTYGQTYAAIPTAEKEGYSFDGWYTAETGGSKVNGSDSVKITAPQTLYAHWTACMYTVTLDARGGNADKSSMQVTYGETYTGLPNASKEGNEFLGWFTDAEGGTKVEAGSKVTVTSSTTLYAHWEPIMYTFTMVYAATSNPNLASEQIQIPYGESRSVTPPYIDGYMTPTAKTVSWDQAEKTITFHYSPSVPVVYESRNPSSVGSSMETDEYASSIMTVNATVECVSRTETSVTYRIVWNDIIADGYYCLADEGHEMALNSSTVGTLSTGRVFVIPRGGYTKENVLAGSVTNSAEQYFTISGINAATSGTCTVYFASYFYTNRHGEGYRSSGYQFDVQIPEY